MTAAPTANVNGYPKIGTPLTGTGGDTIIGTFGGSDAAVIEGKTVAWIRDANGEWTCSTTALQKFAPLACPGA